MKPILPGAPWLIAHKSMLGVNKPNKITLNGKDYVLWQNQKGEVFALNNICPHMQAPLSEGWVCQERNTITCPFHALEFDGNGRLYKEEKVDTKPLTHSLELIVKDDCIWTYGGFEPRLPIPEDLISKISSEYDFIGVTETKIIRGEFLNFLLTSYDFNHQKGLHRDSFAIVGNKISNFQENGYYPSLDQEFTIARHSLADIIKYPAVLTMPKILKLRLEYCFPSVTVVFGKLSIGNVVQVFLVYPENEHQSKAFAILFANFKYGMTKFLLKDSLLKATAKIIEQDTNIIENSYPREKPKIRLPNEEIMFYAEKLYREW